jgi:acetolactate synthase-1/2/3 large subunit
MVKLSDYIMKRLADEHGVRDIFMISGGGAMHLIDSAGKQPGINYLCPHHEQAAAMAAEGYARVSGKIGVVIITSGPGGTNTLTGVIQQWLDSIPCLYISGQVKEETTIVSCPGIGLRQLGDQEINIVDMVRPVTKYAEMVRDPRKIKYYLDKAVYLAAHGRPGPVWLDIPLNVQAALIDENGLEEYDEREDEQFFDQKLLSAQAAETLALLRSSKRPVFVAGHGIRLSGCRETFRKFIQSSGIPVLTTFCGYDLIPSDNKFYAGRIGTLGTRFGNFALQNADLLLSVGSRNNIRQVSYDWKVFARNARKVVVDIDRAELLKPTLKPDLSVQADAGDFLKELLKQSSVAELPDYSGWLAWCTERKKRYPVVQDEYRSGKERINPYYFIETLTNCLTGRDVMVSANGTACVALFQAGIVKEGQRVFWNSGCASMGYDLPASIGACVANGRKPVICLAGDGSIQMNLQELQTIIGYDLPIKIFVLNNDGYISMRQTQESFFNGRHTACDPRSGVTFPEIRKIAAAYGFPVFHIEEGYCMEKIIREVLSYEGPALCEVMLSTTQRFVPKVSSQLKPDGKMVSKPLEDMFPFLPREEFLSNMLVEPLPEQ